MKVFQNSSILSGGSTQLDTLNDISRPTQKQLYENDSQEHTYLKEKYVQEQEASDKYVPKYTSPRPKCYAEGRGPRALQSLGYYNVKLQDYLNESVMESNNDPLVFADRVENYFKLNLQKK